MGVLAILYLHMEKPPSLRELAQQQCVRHAHFIVDFGHTPYHLIRPVLAKYNSKQLAQCEQRNPHIALVDDEIWKMLCQKEFPERTLPAGPYRQAFAQLQSEKDAQLGAARERLILKQKQVAQERASSSISITEPVRRGGTGAYPWRSNMMQQIVKQNQRQWRPQLQGGRAISPPLPPMRVTSPPRFVPVQSPAHSPSHSPPPKRQRLDPQDSGQEPPKRRRKPVDIFIRR